MGPKILVVDDEPAICDLVADLLTDEGYEVQSAPDGQIALDFNARDPPDRITSDVMMPGCDGLSVLQTLRRGGIMIHVVLMSAVPLRQRVVGVPVIPKPFGLDALLAQVHRLLATTRR